MQLAVAFLVGVATTSAVYWQFIIPESGDRSTVANSVPALATNEPAALEQEPFDRNAGVQGVPEGAVRNLEDLQAIDSAFERSRALRNLLVGMDQEQVLELLAQTEDIFSEFDRNLLRSAVVQKLAHINPNLALSRVLEWNREISSRDLVIFVFREWARSDLDEAVSRARTLEFQMKELALGAIVQERADLSEETLRAIARDLGNEKIAISAIVSRKIEEAIDDPAKAWNELAVELQDDRANILTLSQVARAWIEESGLGVLDQIQQSLSNPEMRRNVVNNILLNAANDDPASAFEYALTADGDQFYTSLATVVGVWARSDPRTALAAAAEIENLSMRNSAEESIISTWAYMEPRELWQIIDGLPERLHEIATESAISELVNESPEEAAQLVAGMESSTLRLAATQKVVSYWAFKDYKATLEWLLNEPAIEQDRSIFLGYIIPTLAQTDPDLAMDIALSLPIEDDVPDSDIYGIGAVGMEFNVMQNLSLTDLDKAIELFPQVREGPTKLASFLPVSQQLIGLGEVDRTFALVEGVPESERSKFYMALISTWAGFDAEGLLDSMDRFPGTEVKSRAAMALIAANWISKELSDEQIKMARNLLIEDDAKTLEEGDARMIKQALHGMGLSR